MDTALTDNPTREKILLTLKKKGSMSVDGLSREVSITPMGIRQHLLVLERKGIVEYVTKKHGVGRPGFLYRLTETADELFPKGYQDLALDILSDLEMTDGKGKIDGIFRRRKERLAAELIPQLKGMDTLSSRIRAFSDMLQENGYIVELEEHPALFRLKQFHCPILKVARRFKEACDYDLQLYRELIGEAVRREQCISDGNQSCEYVIPKAQKGFSD
ncbi:MAG TPA: metalloregulator ArsR/SmtB family transcription factor [Thermodesulfovibrionales bacterium]|nr:metalloregulator ArsR/SmtB family transcription factor [Thermodesulfovibrionales bacterium]